jgi:hypothetical protein
MFIDNAEPRCPRSMRSAMFPTIAEMGLHFAPLERDRFAFARSINVSSLREEEDCLEKPWQKNEKLIACFTDQRSIRQHG